ncbi:AAA family ATPase [Microbispora corallina]|uniref:LuxR family transcriptional regulator n=1 Tax=Microbispora corallina TaxID=83302 RepID=A0ABQ4GBX0_9ACTN|nr:LuxR family transcriptional regulator [Microbispora corallina]GIH44562.1 LuxR family transcriptional regulator [Microbispora corallina]
MELWERSETLDLLSGLLRESAHGGRVAVVAGEAGIGKSVLVAEFARRCGPAAWVLWGGCDRLITPRALGPLHDIGRQAGGALAERLNAGAAQEELFAAFLDAVSGPSQRPRPVVVVEDAHWADEATLDWLIWSGRRIGRLPVLFVVTYRDDEVGAEHPLRGALAALPSAITRRVSLPPLSRECVDGQAHRAGRDPEQVYRLSGGNPLLVTELLKAEGRAVPATVQDLVLDRLRQLPRPARELAHLVSVIPTRADAAVVAGAPDLVEMCVDAGVLVPSGDGVSYRHELLRGAVEDTLSPARRAALHRRVLDVLAGVAGIDPGRLVHHATQAGDEAAVLRYGQVAGAGAARQGAHREATAHYRSAAVYADRLPAARRAELLEAYAFQAYLAGLAEEGLRARRAALAVRESLRQPEAAGENLRWISRLAWWAGDAEQAWEAAARAVTVLESEPPGRHLAMAYSNRSQLHMLAGEPEPAVAWGERARTLADRLGDAETSVHAEINVSTARLTGGDETAAAALREVHERASALGMADHAARALVNLATALVQLAEYEAAAPAVDRALAYATGQDLDGYVQYLLGVRAGVRLVRCDWAGALADADAALDRPARAGVAVVPALLARGRIQAARGEPEARATLDEALRQAERTGEVQRVCPVAAARSEYFLLYGDAGRAAEEARRGLDLAGRVRHSVYMGELAYRLWRAGGAGFPEAGARPYRMMADGDWAGAAAEWARRGAPYLRAEALAGGDRGAAAEALRVLGELGATRTAERLRAELRRRGFTGMPRGPRPATAANPGGLTPRQAEVLALLTEGLSNAEIAGRLSLSAKTVDHHISAVLGKLGVASRGQAAAAAHRLNLVRKPAK